MGWFKDVLVTGLSAFGGAWAAFLFESWRDEKREKDKQYRAIKFAHFVVMSQYQEMINFQDTYFKTFKSQDNAWWQMHPGLLGFASPTLNLSELGFILEGSDPDLLNRMTVGEQRYRTVRNIIAYRNQLHSELQRRAAALQAQGIEGAASQEAFDKVLGNDLVKQLKDLTVELFEIHESATSLLEENLSGINKFVSEHFPDRRSPKFEEVPKGERH
jgi:hypothetical protein